MNKKASVYTRGGDKGKTSLVGGTRKDKSSSKVDLYGNVDELNSFIGLAMSEINETKVAGEDLSISFLTKVQSKLFDLGSNLACEPDKREVFKLPQVSNLFVENLELEIDRLDQALPKLDHFILPGGSKASSHLHVCRTVCRRLERLLVAFDKTEEEELPINTLKLVNRLSDYFFTLARYVNLKREVEEIMWEAH